MVSSTTPRLGAGAPIRGHRGHYCLADLVRQLFEFSCGEALRSAGTSPMPGCSSCVRVLPSSQARKWPGACESLGSIGSIVGAAVFGAGAAAGGDPPPLAVIVALGGPGT